MENSKIEVEEPKDAINYVFLDANIIISNPEILSIGNSNYKFVLLKDVIEEINRKQNRLNNSISELLIKTVERAEKAGIVEVVETYPEYIKDIRSYYKLTKLENNIISSAYFLKEEGKNVSLATDDKILSAGAVDQGLEVFSKSDLIKVLNNEDITDNVIINLYKFEELKDYKKSQRSDLLANIIVAILNTLAFIISSYNIESIKLIFSTINIWGSILLIIIFGIMLFLIREKLRLGYGTIEFIVGVYGVSVAFPGIFDYNNITFDVNFGYKILGGLYIMVRGLDNIVKGLQGRKAGIWLKETLDIG